MSDATPADGSGDAEGAWTTSVLAGTAETLHHRDLPWRRGVWLMRPAGPSLVLGSAQREEDVDHGAIGRLALGLTRRRSGGGAVYVSDQTVWVDVVIGRDDRLWVDDVSASSQWLGRAWADTLRCAGLGEFKVHTGAMVHHRLDRSVCFAGLAPGEVLDSDGSKVVGISQRRGRGGARFQCVLHLRWQPELFADALAVEGALEGVSALPVRALIDADSPEWLGQARADEALVARLIDNLPTIA